MFNKFCSIMTGTKHTVTCMTEKALAEATSRPNTSVYTNTHTRIYEPWDVDRLKSVVLRIVNMTSSGMSKKDILASDKEVEEFAKLHEVIFKNVTNVDFVSKKHNTDTLLSLIDLRKDVLSKGTNEDDANAMAANMALEGLTEPKK